MGKFEGQSILEKKSDKPEPSPSQENSENVFDYSPEEAEEILADLDKMLSGVRDDFFDKKDSKESEDKAEFSAKEILEDLDRILEGVDWVPSAAGKRALHRAEYESILNSGKLGSNITLKGWREYWSDFLIKKDRSGELKLSQDIKAIAKAWNSGERVNPRDSNKFFDYIYENLGKNIFPEKDKLKDFLDKKKKDSNREQKKIKNKHRKARVDDGKLKELSSKKRMAIGNLKSGLRAIDNGEDISSKEARGRRSVFYEESSGRLYVKEENGKGREVSFGDLIGDFSWGIKYNPDLSMPRPIWRKIRKALLLAETKARIGKIFNQELNIIYETGIPVDVEFLNELIRSEKSAGVFGLIAERMITEFLIRIQYDNPQLGVRVEPANALEDAVLKYDFKIESRKKIGVALEPKDMSRSEFADKKRSIGIQFTVSKTNSDKKLHQISDAKKHISKFKNIVDGIVDEVVLVSIPELRDFIDYYKKWIKEGRPSGGPEQYMAREQKLEIFKQATKGLIDLSDEELNNLKI